MNTIPQIWTIPNLHKSEPRANPTLITCANKVYEPRMGTTGTHRSIDSLKIQF